MKRFRYPLQGVLGWRVICERELQVEASRLEAALQQEEAAARTLRDELRQVRHMLEAGNDPRRTMMLLSALDSVSVRLAQQDDRVRLAHQAWSEKRDALMEASRERKKLERHKEKQAEAQTERAEAAERKTLDDMTTARYVHRQLRENRG